jgi:16S rRNA (uracil1498-N3)-methyltransferase
VPGVKPRRLPVESLPVEGGVLELSAEAARHLRVLRLGPGAPLLLFDGAGHEADAELLELQGERARVRLSTPRTLAPLGTALVLLVGVTRGAKLDDIVRACTEIGVRELRPVVCERSQVHAEPSPARQERLARIALEAARQCGRPDVPVLHPAEPLLRGASRASASAARFAFQPGAAPALSERLGRVEAGSEVWAVVGPEGGLGTADQAELTTLGYETLGLGPTTLRVETAASVVAALVCARLRAAGG